MRVLKRNGELVEVKFDEITQKIKNLCTSGSHGSNILDSINPIDPIYIAMEVIKTIYDGITTSQLDEYTASVCANLSIKNYDYGILASRLAINNHHKNTLKSFCDSIQEIPNIDEDIKKYCSQNKKILDNLVDLSRDYLISYFGFNTLYKSYLLKNKDGKTIETPQFLFLRVSLGIHYNKEKTDINKVKTTYDLLSKKYFTHATPTLFNAGTQYPQMSSCYLIGTEDSVDGIFKTISDVAMISKWAGGVGVHISNIRADGSKIEKTAGKSQGIMPMMKVYNDTARYINQSSKRLGSFAMYLEPWHADIFKFLDAKKNNGADENRARDLFYALWIPDLFMERVKSKQKWSLMCPNESPNLTETYGDSFEKLYLKYESEGKYKKQIEALELWNAIINSQIETGTPYMCYKDSVNKKSNQKNIGIIKSSNLCVIGSTKILTDEGYFEIESLKDQKVNVWNGEEFSEVTIKQTGTNQKITKVVTNIGNLECTYYHKFYVVENEKIIIKQANELCSDDILINPNYPIIDGKLNFEDAYTHGYYLGFYKQQINTEDNLFLKKINKIIVPINFSRESKLKFIQGLKDGSESNTEFIINDEKLLEYTKLLFNTIGQQAHITLNKIILCDKPIKIIEFIDDNKLYNTFCFNEPKKHMGIFNGILTGNCTEIMEYSDSNQTAVCNLASICLPSYLNYNYVKKCIIYSKTNCKYCKLSKQLLINKNIEYEEINLDNDTIRYEFYREKGVNSVPQIFINDLHIGGHTDLVEYLLPEFDFDKLGNTVEIIVENLNIIIDKNYYPTKESNISNLKHRPIGIGVQGLADVFMKLRYPFTSENSRKLNKQIFECIYYFALKKSCELSKINGNYSSYMGSPISKGILQYDLWNKTPEYYLSEFNNIKNQILKYGVRNSLLIAPMPTASTAQIMGNNESFEPYTSNIYTRKVLSGEFIVINNNLIEELKYRELLNENIIDKLIYNKGSIQNIEEIPKEIREIYKTAWEISQKAILEMSADRGAYICQSQSLNIFIADADPKKISSVHLYGYSLGLKTGSYYIRTKSILNNQNFSMDYSKEQSIKEISKKEENSCEMCSS